MPSLKDLRTRIKSVKNTQQITKTMKMVAAAKVRRARMNAESARPYAQKLNETLVHLSRANANNTAMPLLLSGRDEVKTVRILVFGSDRGLCGGFNGNLAKSVIKHMEKITKSGKKVQLVTLGRKVHDLLKVDYADLIVDTSDDMGKNITYVRADEVGTKAVEAFEEGKCDQVIMMYNHFESMMTQRPTLQQLAPFSLDDEGVSDEAIAPYEYEPEEEVILEKLLPQNLKLQIYQAMLETNASEQAARMTAMESATKNAGDMIKRLNLEYNRSRQAAITTELTEIISGAEAL